MGRVESLAPTRAPGRCAPGCPRQPSRARVQLSQTTKAGYRSSPLLLVEMGRVELPSGEAFRDACTSLARLVFRDHGKSGPNPRSLFSGHVDAVSEKHTAPKPIDNTRFRSIGVIRADGFFALRREPARTKEQTLSRVQPSRVRTYWQLFRLSDDS